MAVPGSCSEMDCLASRLYSPGGFGAAGALQVGLRLMEALRRTVSLSLRALLQIMLDVGDRETLGSERLLELCENRLMAASTEGARQVHEGWGLHDSTRRIDDSCRTFFLPCRSLMYSRALAAAGLEPGPVGSLRQVGLCLCLHACTRPAKHLPCALPAPYRWTCCHL